MTRLRITTTSVVLFVVLLAAGIVLRNVVGRSTRVLGWLLAATVVAALLHPVVGALTRRMPRVLALVVVVVSSLAIVGGVIYAAFDDLSREVTRLQQAAPDAARRIEASERFGRAAREFGLTERVTDFVNALPRHVTGGGSGGPLSTATRGIAYLAGVVLTIFLLLYGPRFVESALLQIHDDTRRANTARILASGYQRWWRYVLLTLGRAALAGLFAYLVCRLAGLPGAVVLSLVVAIVAVVPYLGVIVGSLPIVLLAVGLDPSAPRAVTLFGVFLAYQLIEAFVVQPRLDGSTVRVGPAITVLVAMVAFELYGLGGALYGVATVVFAVAILDELAPTDADTVDLTELERPVARS